MLIAAAPVQVAGQDALAAVADQAGPASLAPEAAGAEKMPSAAQGVPADPQDAIVVRGRSRRGDPLEGPNAAAFEATQAVDDAVVGPAARIYKTKLPSPLRKALHNFIWNLREPVVFLNYLFQLKPGKAAETAGRFALNTTVGLAGTIDVARKKPFNLPRRRNSFANTLGRYGVGPGPFLFLPLIGPTTVRDLFGTVVDQTVSPIGPVQVFRNNPAITAPLGVLSALDYRVQIEDDLDRVKKAPDPYAARRRQYLAQRQADIDRLRGRVTPPPVVPTIPELPVVPPPVVPTIAAPPADAP